MSSSKRKTTSSLSPQSKKPRTKRSESERENRNDTQERFRDWPAPREKMEEAREFIKECVEGGHLTLLVPDKDADGLSSGKIMHHTLTVLGLPETKMKVHMLAKASSVFQPTERKAMESYGATRIIFLDQGSRAGPPLVSPFVTAKCTNPNHDLNLNLNLNPDSDPDPNTDPSPIPEPIPESPPPPPPASPPASQIPVQTLIIDHHQTTSFPQGSHFTTSIHSPPIATSSVLTYLICFPLHPSVHTECAVPALLGLFGDLGPNAVKWGRGQKEEERQPWPAYLGEVVKKVTKKALLEAVSAMNAPRRTAEYKVNETWETVLRAKSLPEISNNALLKDARRKVNAEIERCTRTHQIANSSTTATAPLAFSRDGRVALLTINSAYQVHPVLAARWAAAGRFSRVARGSGSGISGSNSSGSGNSGGGKLQLVMVANEGYHPSGLHTNFSCRIVAGLRRLPEEERPNLIEILMEYARKVPEDERFLERCAADFARGHKEASGGIVLSSDFELLKKAMEIGVRPEKPEKPEKPDKPEKPEGVGPKEVKRKELDPNQKTKLTAYFKPRGVKQ